jgi:chromosome segregation ATPase
MMAALFLCVVWTTHSLTKAKADVGHLNDTVRQLSDAASNSDKQAADMRQQAESARVAAANAQGQLDAAKTHLDSLKAQLQRATEAQQALQARYLADAAQQSAARDTTSDNPKPVAATQPTATSQPFLRWSETITRPINP